MTEEEAKRLDEDAGLGCAIWGTYTNIFYYRQFTEFQTFINERH